jgi:formate hydrogenlyase transcriptional activator
MTERFSIPNFAETWPSDAWCGLIGRSAPIRALINQLKVVAPTDSTVLIVGETGTGKELVARALHGQGQRRGGPFIRLNCAALPVSLLESELFGHEKGTFTGAISRRVGRFEQAEAGSIFLDEIGELALEIQPKLLRILQERELERLGGTQTIHVDVRLIAATNRSLSTMCARKEFREDLYYRLNVFPVFVPPLRERRDDIPLLVRAFVAGVAARLHQDIREVDVPSMAALQAYDWPGNVRELQNVLERAVILAQGPVLTVPLDVLATHSRPVAEVPATSSLEDVSRAHILSVLRSTNGVVAGPNGAATRLGMKRSTLKFRMKKLGISPAAARSREAGAAELSPSRVEA